MRINKLYLAAAFSTLTLAGCGDITDPAEVDSTTRIALSKDIPEFTASGLTTDGEDAYRGIVTIVRGDRTNDISWDMALDDPK